METFTTQNFNTMKLAKFSFMLALTFVVILYSCNNANPKDLIVSKWKLKEFIPNPEFQVSDSITDLVLATRTIEYTADNQYTQMSAGQTQTGTYSMSEDGKIISYIQSGSGETYVDTIIELTKDKLSVIDQNGNRMTSMK